jgi:hypothetical protein
MQHKFFVPLIKLCNVIAAAAYCYYYYYYYYYQSSSFSLEHRASKVVEVSVAFKFFTKTGLLALCSNPQPGGPGLHIYTP